MGFGKDGKGAIIREQRLQALTTLAATTAIFIGTKLATVEDFRILKTEVFAFVNGCTADETEGLVFGIADGVLSLAEVEAAMELNAPVNPNDTPNAEEAERFVKVIGLNDGDITATKTSFHFRDGKTNGLMMQMNVRWTFNAGDSWNWFVYNRANGLLTTGSTVLMQATNYGVWVR